MSETATCRPCGAQVAVTRDEAGQVVWARAMWEEHDLDGMADSERYAVLASTWGGGS